MKKPALAILLVCVCLVCLGAVGSGRLHFKATGFSIQLLEARPGSTGYVPLMMHLEASDGFSPNVNVAIQPYAGTIGQYVDLSKKEFAASKFKSIKETRQGKASVLLEYSGQLQGRQFHWYAKAISTGKAVYLATATATEAQWPAVGAKLKACVDSFALDKGTKGAEGGGEGRAR